MALKIIMDFLKMGDYCNTISNDYLNKSFIDKGESRFSHKCRHGRAGHDDRQIERSCSYNPHLLYFFIFLV